MPQPGGRASAPGGVTVLLQAWGSGDRAALDQLVPSVYAELQRVARGQLRGERPDHSLQPTALVHEAFLRLVELRKIQWRDRGHFFAMAATIMRRILVDAARARLFEKRGAGAPHVGLDEALLLASTRGHDLIALDDALTRLAATHPRKARVVELRFFAGATLEETARALAISSDTVTRDWHFARAWLLRDLGARGPS